ncbi:MAG: molybdate ABC transporter substrate-binding protein [Pseudomonadota bacterium]
MISRILVVIGLLFLSPLLHAGEVKVAVASNFLETMRALALMFEQQSAHRITISAASSGVLYAQITKGAPFDVYLAANAEYPALLVKQGRAVAGSLHTYSLGRLVLVSHKDLPGDSDIAVILRNSTGRIAIANPRTAPYGSAAQAVIEKLGLTSALQSRLVVGENVAQTLQFVATGNAELGFVALAQVLGKEAKLSIYYRELPEGSYPPIEQQMVLLKQENPAASAFMQFMRLDAARDVIRRHGYGVSAP